MGENCYGGVVGSNPIRSTWSKVYCISLREQQMKIEAMILRSRSTLYLIAGKKKE